MGNGTTASEPWSIKTHCYLCGLPLAENGPTNRDHVPPKRVFVRALRPHVRGGLLTVRTHAHCQFAYARDEEYWFNTLLPNALEGPLGPQLAEDFRHLIRHDKVNAQLSETVLRQFEERPSGLILPPGIVVQRIEGKRVTRVVWKIVRGLFAVERNAFLPDDKARSIGIHTRFEPDIPRYIRPLLGRDHRGHTPQCFGYVFTTAKTEAPQWDKPDLHMWALFLWQTHVISVAFHDPACACQTCTGPETE